MTTNTSYFLGAGASKSYGYLLTTELMPEILRELSSRTIFGPDEDQMADFELLIKELFPGVLKPNSDLPLITDILSLVDSMIAGGHGLSPDISNSRLVRLRTHLERAILKILSRPADIQRFKDNSALLTEFVKTAIDNRSSIISTNYDSSIEERLAALENTSPGKSVDFGLSWRDPGASDARIWHRPQTPEIRIFKLHGSLNWLKCPSCGFLYINRYGSITSQAFRSEIDEFNTCHCDYAPLEPHIVSPSLARQIDYTNLFSVWQAAFEALRTTEKWVIVGYSLPVEDIHIRSMLIRALRARSTKPNIVVVQLNPDSDLENRYRFLLPECSFVYGGFEVFLASNNA